MVVIHKNYFISCCISVYYAFLDFLFCFVFQIKHRPISFWPKITKKCFSIWWKYKIANHFVIWKLYNFICVQINFDNCFFYYSAFFCLIQGCINCPFFHNRKNFTNCPIIIESTNFIIFYNIIKRKIFVIIFTLESINLFTCQLTIFYTINTFNFFWILFIVLQYESFIPSNNFHIIT